MSYLPYKLYKITKNPTCIYLVQKLPVLLREYDTVGIAN